MNVIWKFPLAIIGSQDISVPARAEILSVQVQHDGLQLWALVDPGAAFEVRVFEIFGTGHAVPPGPGKLKFIATVQTDNGRFVWHVFERVSGW